VDEAYRLTNSGSEVDFGPEAVEEIMRDLESGDPLVCIAGYPKEMDAFLQANPGLKRRFPLVFEFPDYSPQELAQIFVRIVTKKNYFCGANVTVQSVSELIQQHTTPHWRAEQNGAIANALFSKTLTELDRRLPPDFTKTMAETFELLDIRAAAANLMVRSVGR